MNFNNQHGCHKCCVVGEWSRILHFNIFPRFDCEKRTDAEFRSRVKDYDKHFNFYEEYYVIDDCQKKVKVPIETPLLRIASIDMVQDIVISDSLHLLHLGVLKTLLTLYKDGSNYDNGVRWSKDALSTMSRLLESARLPVEIHRKVRPIDIFLTHWKGSECATFLNYLSIVVLKDFLPSNHYCNFLIFFCATTICSTDYYRDSLPSADILFKDFVENYYSLFKSATSNMHNLIHVVDEVTRFGNLNTLSAYTFENKLFLIKKLLRSGKFPLAQAANRLSEITLCDQKQSISHEFDNKFPMISLYFRLSNSLLRLLHYVRRSFFD